MASNQQGNINFWQPNRIYKRHVQKQPPLNINGVGKANAIYSVPKTWLPRFQEGKVILCIYIYMRDETSERDNVASGIELCADQSQQKLKYH